MIKAEIKIVGSKIYSISLTYINKIHLFLKKIEITFSFYRDRDNMINYLGTNSTTQVTGELRKFV